MSGITTPKFTITINMEEVYKLHSDKAEARRAAISAIRDWCDFAMERGELSGNIVAGQTSIIGTAHLPRARSRPTQK